MSSQINTNGINVNYPVPGTNNNSQGFRDNYVQIRTNLNTAASEITDLQNNVVLKQALANTVLNNDMANTLISNASTRSFRATTYNLGNSLSGTVLVDVSRGDVQYGSVTGNLVLQFGGWAPTNTQSNVTIRLTMANTSASIALPNACISTNNDYGVTILENIEIIGNTAYLTAPANTTVLQYSLSSIDCGNSISVVPINRPYDTTQIITRDVSPTGLLGDMNGTVAVSPSIGQVTVTQTANVPTVITANAFTSTGTSISGTTMTIGTLATGAIAPGMLLTGAAANTYIVSSISGTGSGSTWVVSPSQTLASTSVSGNSGIIGTTLTVGVQTSGTVQEGMVLSGSGVTANTFIVKNISGSGSGSTWQVSASQYAAPTTIGGNIDVMTSSSTDGFYRDMPITFTGNVIGGVTAGTTYYVKEVADANSFTISSTAGGSMFALSNASGSMSGNPASYVYVCTDSYDSTTYASDVVNAYVTSNYITVEPTNDLQVNAPIIFQGDMGNTGILANTVYYIKSIVDVSSPSGNITVSRTRVNGVAGSVALVSETDTMTANSICYVGNDIWKRITPSSW